MKIVDLTLPHEPENITVTPRIVPLRQADGREYAGICPRVDMNSMTGSYIDFPGHIDVTENGRNAVSADMADYYRRPAAVIRPIPDENGMISRKAIEKSAENLPGGISVLVINALNGKEIGEVPLRGTWLALEAVDWIIEKGFRIIISDIWEKPAYEGVFFRLFKCGIDCVCMPRNLSLLPSGTLFWISVAFLPVPEAVQTPCRILAEIP